MHRKSKTPLKSKMDIICKQCDVNKKPMKAFKDGSTLLKLIEQHARQNSVKLKKTPDFSHSNKNLPELSENVNALPDEACKTKSKSSTDIPGVINAESNFTKHSKSAEIEFDCGCSEESDVLSLHAGDDDDDSFSIADATVNRPTKQVNLGQSTMISSSLPDTDKSFDGVSVLKKDFEESCANMLSSHAGDRVKSVTQKKSHQESALVSRNDPRTSEFVRSFDDIGTLNLNSASSGPRPQNNNFQNICPSSTSDASNILQYCPSGNQNLSMSEPSISSQSPETVESEVLSPLKNPLGEASNSKTNLLLPKDPHSKTKYDRHHLFQSNESSCTVQFATNPAQNSSLQNSLVELSSSEQKVHDSPNSPGLLHSVLPLPPLPPLSLIFPDKSRKFETCEKSDTFILEPNAAKRNQEPDIAEMNQEPGIVEMNQEPDIAEQNQEPNIAEQNQEPDIAGQNQEPDIAGQNQEPDVAEQNQEPVIGEQTQGLDISEQYEESSYAEQHSDSAEFSQNEQETSNETSETSQIKISSEAIKSRGQHKQKKQKHTKCIGKICRMTIDDRTCMVPRCRYEHDIKACASVLEITKMLEKVPDNADEVIHFFKRKVMRSQDISICILIYMKIITAFYHCNRFDLVLIALKSAPNGMWRYGHLVERFILLTVQESYDHQLFLACVDVILEHKQNLLAKAITRKFLLCILENPERVLHLKTVMHALQDMDYKHCIIDVFDILFLKATWHKQHLEVCNQFLRSCPSIIKHLQWVNRNTLIAVGELLQECNFTTSAGIIDAFFRAQHRGIDVHTLDINLDNPFKPVCKRPWCCVNCVLTMALFSGQSKEEKMAILQRHVKDGNYICALNLLESSNCNLQLLINGCMHGIIEDETPCNVTLDSFLSHYRPDRTSENTFFEGLSWSLFLKLKQMNEVEEACLVVRAIVKRKIVLDSSDKDHVNKTLVIAKTLFQQSLFLDVWAVLNLNNYGQPSCEAPPTLYQIQQKEHLLFLFKCVKTFLEKCYLKYAFLLLQSTLELYKEKTHLYDLYKLDLNLLFHEVMLGLVNCKIELISKHALPLYHLYHDLFQEDHLLPIELSPHTERALLSYAVNKNQWKMAEHLFNSGKLKGYLPTQSIEQKPFRIFIYSYMTIAEILLTFFQFFKYLEKFSDMVIQDVGRYRENLDIFTLNICIEEQEVPENGPFDYNISESANTNALDVKFRIKQVSQNLLKPPLHANEHNERMLTISGCDIYDHVYRQELPRMNEDPIYPGKISSKNIPPVDVWEF